MDWVPEVADVDDPNRHADQGDDLRELLAELIQLLLQRRLLLLRSHHLIPDLTDLCGDAGGNDHAGGTARCNVCALRKKRKEKEREGEISAGM